MKVTGLLGGMSWESTVSYYQLINREIGSRLGGLHSGKIILYSLDFEEIEKLQHQGAWEEATQIMIDGALRVQRAGADFLVICTNTMHLMAEVVQEAIEIPILHIADATAKVVRAQGISRVGLLGTRFTMEQDFYRGRLIKQHSLDILIPEGQQLDTVHSIIYNELCLGKVMDSSRAAYREVIKSLIERGAEGIILGCTEIGLLIGEEEFDVPLFDTAEIHAQEAVTFALA